MLLLVVTLAGCSEDADCVSLCEDWAENECCAKNDFGEGCSDDPDDCEELCEGTERLAKHSGCKQELDDWNACAAELDDICDDSSSCASRGEGDYSCTGGGCDGEMEKWVECFLAYCNEHPDDTDCV